MFDSYAKSVGVRVLLYGRGAAAIKPSSSGIASVFDVSGNKKQRFLFSVYSALTEIRKKTKTTK